jgi:hypothetical protein
MKKLGTPIGIGPSEASERDGSTGRSASPAGTVTAGDG